MLPVDKWSTNEFAAVLFQAEVNVITWPYWRSLALRSVESACTERCLTFLIITDFLSREAWLKTNQKKAMQQDGRVSIFSTKGSSLCLRKGCRRSQHKIDRIWGGGLLYSCVSRPVSSGSLGTYPNSQVLPYISYNWMSWFRPFSQWLNGKMWQHWTAPIQTYLAAPKL